MKNYYNEESNNNKFLTMICDFFRLSVSENNSLIIENKTKKI